MFIGGSIARAEISDNKEGYSSELKRYKIITNSCSEFKLLKILNKHFVVAIEHNSSLNRRFRRIVSKSLIDSLFCAGIQTDLEYKKFDYLFELYRKLEHELLNDQTIIHIPFFDDLPSRENSPIYIVYKTMFEDMKKLKTEKVLELFFRNPLIVFWLKDDKIPADKFIDILENHQNMYLRRRDFYQQMSNFKINFYCQKRRFFSRWGGFYQREMVQGYQDPDSILGRGVCLAFVKRIYLLGLMNPEISIEEIENELKVTPLDRYTQASYIVNLLLRNINISKAIEDVEPYYFKKINIISEILFEILYNPYLSSFDGLLDAKLHRLNKSAGWLQLNLFTHIGGHAMLLRWDEQRNNYWIIDPDLGFFVFERPSIENEKAQINLIKCLKQLFFVFYPSTYRIKGLIYVSALH